MIVLSNSHGTATVDPYGGQVMTYVPAGGVDLLWQTSDAQLSALKAGGKALRGGVPVCWPWFGPHPTDKSAPAHGLARIATWQVGETGTAHAVLHFAIDGSHPAFPYAAEARLTATLTDVLEVELTTTNTGHDPFRLTECLHTYLRVGDIGSVEIAGLEGAISNKGDQSADPLRIVGEVDRIYGPVTGPLRVVDPALGRILHIQNEGCTEAVVWNPGSDKSDMTAGGYRHMLCVEPANVRDAPVLQPQSSHTISTRLWQTKLG